MTARAVPVKHPSLRSHVFRALVAMMAALLVCAFVTAAVAVQKSLLDEGREELMRECEVVASALDLADDPVAFAQKLDTEHTRLTLVAADGRVVYDSVVDAESMLNHLDRPEVAEALASGEGFSTRRSETVLEVSLYGARLLDDGMVVRLSVTRESVLGVLGGMVPLVAAIALVGLVAGFSFSSLISHRLVDPLARIDPRHPLADDAAGAYEEVMPLLRQIDEQHSQIEDQLVKLVDVDRTRVEFTANVTHELKTPLTVISGYAELIETGIARPEDVPGFAGRIREEARRLTDLVNDILTLSRMDEAERVDEAVGAFEPVDLAQVCASAAHRLEERCAELGISMECDAGPAVVRGVPRLIDQIVYNLCDNAVRYNRPDGSVFLKCGVDADGRPFVSVRDTGIGIAPENVDRVFNRFFRVDASRSRETGGTGLGLAIVKHAARCHDASVEVQSALGEGTRITVTFSAAGL